MTDEESAMFKALVKPAIEYAIGTHGGIDRCREIYRDVPAMLYFIAGTAYGWIRCTFNQEKVRRLLDLVRLRLESESTTS